MSLDEPRVVSSAAPVDTSSAGSRFSAIRFGSPDSLPAAIEAVYRLDLDNYRGEESLQLTLEYVRA